jgi:hypothetical protein
MDNRTFDRTSLQVSAVLLLVGQLLYVVITLFHRRRRASPRPRLSAGWSGG